MTTNTNAALDEYANPLNLDADANGVRRIWREPGSDTPDAYNGFEMARAALTTAAAVPPEGFVMVPVELAERVQESLGEFLMDHGWSQRDMDTSDDFGAVLLAADPKAEPVPAVQQGDELPREDFAWLVVQEACETEPADEDDPECIRILRRDLKSAVLSAFLRHDAAHPAAPVAQGDALIDFIESAGSVHIHRVRAGFNGPIRWDVEYGYEDAKVSGRTLRDALSGVLKAGAASAAKELGA